jgi:hypothetical protein
MDGSSTLKTAKTIEPSPPRERMPRGVWLTALGLTAWLVVPWSLILATDLQGIYILGVVVLFTVIAFGTATICALRNVHSRRSGGTDKRRIGILTGILPLNAAATQLLLVPAAVAVGFTLIALINVAERVS